MKISILGCGWLGFPLALQLIKDGYSVKGSSRSNKKLRLLTENSVLAFHISLPEDFPDRKTLDFWKSDVLFLNIPPGRGTENIIQKYTEKVSMVRKILEGPHATIKKVIFASSTSVYPADAGYYTEEDTEPGNTSRPSGEAVLQAENILRESGAFSTIILRFGGLYGYDRHPVKYLSGKTNIPSPLKPVNLIHQDDCIQIVCKLLENGIENGVYNAVSDGHPPRKTLYTEAAKYFEILPPGFDDKSESINRVISNKKLKEDLNYTFIYPNPLDHP